MSDLIHNSHAGELLVSEFLVPKLADTIGCDQDELRAVVAGEKPMNADQDGLLCAYFRMSKGFFLRLQDDYEAMEAMRRGEA